MSVGPDPPELLHHFLEAQADLTPDATALVCRGERWTYGDLERESNRLARYLRSLGAGPRALVGIYCDRSEKHVVSVLAVLKSGAAYVPVDPGLPTERVRHILADAGISILMTDATLRERAREVFEGQSLVFEEADAAARQDGTRLSSAESGASPSDLCYVIYTSGTTGRPKGVMTEHRNAVGFVRSFAEVCALGSQDRVYHGFSLGFDGSVEEMWMAFSSGAALVVGTSDVAKLGSEVARLLTEQRVTFFSTVPTFLSMIQDDLPSVRTLVVSGEQCPPEMVARWAITGRRMLNVYGPTETTVNTTVAECRPGEPVTIGKPIAGYDIHILDDQFRPVPRGQPGELYIGGIGVARGYLGQPEITAKHFIPNPLDGEDPSSRLYRTGDLVRLDSAGDLVFLGRIDTQVKVRGYRIELSEIESVLREHPQIRMAATHVVEHGGMKKLAACVVRNPNVESLDRDDVLSLLQKRLPAYMVPDFLDVDDELPTLASGKVDRRRLPAPRTPLVRSAREIVPPSTELEREIVIIWEKVFDLSPVSVEDDFFLDLGGHSLLAAQMVSLLRTSSGREVAIRDVYAHPTVKELSRHLDSVAEPPVALEVVRPTVEAVSPAVRRTVQALQCLGLYVLYGVRASPILAGYLIYAAWSDGMAAETAVAVAFGLLLAWYPSLLLATVTVKWLVIGRYRPGRYPLWGSYYLRWWFVDRFQALGGAALLAGTPWMSVYYRLMGAKVGRGCMIDTSLCSIFDLVTLGDETSIGNETQLLGYRVEDGMLVIGRVDIGSRCFVGIHSALGLDTRMGDDSRLDDLSLLPDGDTVPDGESRCGSPAVPARIELPGPGPRRGRGWRFALGLAQLVAVYALEVFYLLVGVPIALAWYGLTRAGVDWRAAGLLAVGCLALPSFCLGVAAVKFVLLRKVEPGVYPVHGFFFLRKWFVDTLIRASVGVARPLYTTIYLPAWLRMLGARIGKRAEISTVSQISPELVRIEDESFFADGSIIGGRRFSRNQFEIGESRIGRRSFVGNSAILPIGASLGRGCLLGCLSAPPERRGQVPDGTDWVGSPSFRLPRRQRVEGFEDAVTYRPTPKLYAQRLVVDALRILIPGFLAGAWLVGFLVFVGVALSWGLLLAVALTPVASLLLSVAAALGVVVVKKVLIPKFRPIVKPLWSPYVWFNEVINGAYESLAVPMLSSLLGTPWFAVYLRRLGCKIGRGVFLNTSLFSEFDLVHVGDRVTLNAGAVIQNHLFEDRIMKASNLFIEEDCSVGNMAVILYDTRMGRGSRVGPLSLLMKGEELPDSTDWLGIPTRQRALSQGARSTGGSRRLDGRVAGSHGAFRSLQRNPEEER